VSNKKIEIDCEGIGTREDPILIDPQIDLPTNFKIFNSDLHVNIEKLDLYHIGVYRSHNISIRQSKIVALVLNRCSNMQILEVSNLKYLDLIRSDNNSIANCLIGKFKAYSSTANRINGCTIDKIGKYKRSKDNFFTDNQIPPKQKKKLVKKQKEKTKFFDY